MYSIALMSRDLFSPRQAAVLLSVSPRCVLDYCNSGRLEAVTLTSRAVRITGASLNDLAAGRSFVKSWRH